MDINEEFTKQIKVTKNNNSTPYCIIAIPSVILRRYDFKTGDFLKIKIVEKYNPKEGNIIPPSKDRGFYP